jgi:hypothetical protein
MPRLGIKAWIPRDDRLLPFGFVGVGDDVAQGRSSIT